MISTTVSTFMRSKKATVTGLTIGAIGALTATFNFDPVQLSVSLLLILCEVTLMLENKKQ
jgi:hypothetical protein